MYTMSIWEPPWEVQLYDSLVLIIKENKKNKVCLSETVRLVVKIGLGLKLWKGVRLGLGLRLKLG